jgi:Poxvirus A32 protein
MLRRTESVNKKNDDLKKMPKVDQERTHRNVLVVLDDVVG